MASTNEEKQEDVELGQDDGREEEDEIITALSTQALEQKLSSLQTQSSKLSQSLTQKLATSQSGQNLLHIGSSLSTLPPDLHALLTHLHPVLSDAESMEKQHLQNLQKLVQHGTAIRLEQRRLQHAAECAELYMDLEAAEQAVSKWKRNILVLSTATGASGGGSGGEQATLQAELDHAASLERAAHITLLLVQDLHQSSQQVTALKSPKSPTELPSLKTALDHDTERAQFVMKLAPRIRKLENDVVSSLSAKLETSLQHIQRRREEEDSVDNFAGKQENQMNEELFLIGHSLRGLAILRKGGEAENVFARVAIMPLIRSKISMGRLDDGGARGECAGLPSLLQDMLDSIAKTFGPVLTLSESMFSGKEVDLITAGVWVPIATALLADAGVKMAIFSPGIASILQANYVALDKFLSGLSTKLLLQASSQDDMQAAQKKDSLERLYYPATISTDAAQLAQKRVFSHPKTAEFSNKWNLPIYYQLRFGDCCTRLNKAVDRTKREGWMTNVFDSEDTLERMRQSYGMELPLFLEVYDILSSFWKSDVFLRPLTHRFLRGSYQIVGLITDFVRDGMYGKIEFGEEPPPPPDQDGGPVETLGDDNFVNSKVNKTPLITRAPYKWGESLEDVAAVAWDLTVLESKLQSDQVAAAKFAAGGGQVGDLIAEALSDAALSIGPLVRDAWNDVLVNLLISKCSAPLGAVKGVAATYRMTNRPPPTKASPFVPTILRPLQQFQTDFRHRIPLGAPHWKISVVNTVSDRYASAVEELIVTIQRTEVALQNRRARRMVAGGMSDSDKVKLQLSLDCAEFVKSIQQVGVDPATVEGVSKLEKLTQGAGNEEQQQRNGA